MKALKNARLTIFVSLISILGFQSQLLAQDASHELSYNGDIGRIINEICVT